jgi:hypothetical protein
MKILQRGRPMSESLCDWGDRFLGDLLLTLIPIALVSMLAMIILSLDFDIWIVYYLFLIAAGISIIHIFLCQKSKRFFWKFAFLLPGDIYYYILAKNKCKSEIPCQKIEIKLPTGSKLIMKKPDQEKPV